MSWGRFRPSASTAASMPAPLSRVGLDDEGDDERGKQGIDADGFRERHAKNHVRLNSGPVLRIAAERLHCLADEHSDAESRTDAAETHGDAGADRLTDIRVVEGATGGLLQERQEAQNAEEIHLS